MEWKFSKYNNVGEEAMEDIAAEIEHILIKGVAYSPRECQKCHSGIPNLSQDRCV